MLVAAQSLKDETRGQIVQARRHVKRVLMSPNK